MLGVCEAKKEKSMISKDTALGHCARTIYLWIRAGRTKPTFAGSGIYWEQRYAQGGNSGVGSYGKFAEFKAEQLNSFVAQHGVHTVIEFGCGDGNQLSLAKYRSFTGFDVSEAAITLCKRRFAPDKTKTFKLLHEYGSETADLTLSLDVLYHLVEDEVFDSHMRTLFLASNRYVAIYSSDSSDDAGANLPHVRHRNFTNWIDKNLAEWKLLYHIPNRLPYKGDYKTGSWADLFIYQKTGQPCSDGN
jgi:SAM-dependent methyltransferase